MVVQWSKAIKIFSISATARHSRQLKHICDWVRLQTQKEDLPPSSTEESNCNVERRYTASEPAPSNLATAWHCETAIHIESDARRMERSGEGERITRLRDEANWVKEERRYRKSLGIRPSRALLTSKISISVELKAQQRLSRSFKGEET
jgi:hypothetical protein